ncbi:MAG TPA: patatin-like phospholipase family protein [Thermomicrobiales bacterium]|nr:patatin-like phospholipase family protein [Thermomicrobiales bacterium]
MHRRAFVSALSASAIAAGSRFVSPPARSLAAVVSPEDGRTDASRQVATPAAAFDDGLAHPIPYTPPLGAGKDRALVLGGGGVYLLSFYVGYFGELLKHGVDVGKADIIVGTSAGSIFGAIVASGKFAALAQEPGALDKFAWLYATIKPNEAQNPSQLRASQIAVAAKEATPEAIQSIGRAAMAAHNPAGPLDYHKAVNELLSFSDWPSPAFHTTANDCYTGERNVVSQEDVISVDVACAASSSPPGQTGPTWLKDRLCMDGGICQTTTHCDVVTGVKRALVVSLTDGGLEAVEQGLRISGLNNTLQQEVADLRADGTQTMLVAAGLEPGSTRIDSIMDPKYIAPQIAFGKERATADLEQVRAVWA